jgi:hypothetical protein
MDCVQILLRPDQVDLLRTATMSLSHKQKTPSPEGEG